MNNDLEQRSVNSSAPASPGSGALSLSVPYFLSCDWGTSSLRLRVVRSADLTVDSEVRANDGIAVTYQAWKTAQPSPVSRFSYFLAVLRRHLDELERQSGRSLAGLPLVMSGMASSSIGCREVPYAMMPIAANGSDLRVETIEQNRDFPHDVLLISGARSENDVMRGEETQLTGALLRKPDTRERQLFIFPGTHSKHVVVENGYAVGLTTFMTGEFFELLSRKSVLAASVQASDAAGTAEDRAEFRAGVCEGAAKNLLHACFDVRVRSLLNAKSPSANYHYLSGLLIGSELGTLRSAGIPVTLVGNGELAIKYFAALRILNVEVAPDLIDVDDALIRGQWVVWCNFCRASVNR